MILSSCYYLSRSHKSTTWTSIPLGKQCTFPMNPTQLKCRIKPESVCFSISNAENNKPCMLCRRYIKDFPNWKHLCHSWKRTKHTCSIHWTLKWAIICLWFSDTTSIYSIVIGENRASKEYQRQYCKIDSKTFLSLQNTCNLLVNRLKYLSIEFRDKKMIIIICEMLMLHGRPTEQFHMFWLVPFSPDVFSLKAIALWGINLSWSLLDASPV